MYLFSYLLWLYFQKQASIWLLLNHIFKTLYRKGKDKTTFQNKINLQILMKNLLIAMALCQRIKGRPLPTKKFMDEVPDFLYS